MKSKMSSVRKIIIDSRYFLNDAPAGKGTFELSEIVEIHNSQVMFLESFQCVNSWFTCDSSNNSIYLVENGSSGGFKARIATIAACPYDSDSLGSAIQDALNAGRSSGIGSYTVTRSTSNTSTTTTGVGSAAFRYYTITLAGGNFAIPDFKSLGDPVFYQWWLTYGGPSYSIESLQSSNDLFEFVGAGAASSTGIAVNTTCTSGYVDLRAKHSLCLHSTDIGNMTSMGPRGIRTCIAVIPVTQPYGSMTVFQGNGNIHDYIEPATRTLKRMTFEVQSFRGETVDFQGGHWTAVFVIGTRPA